MPPRGQPGMMSVITSTPAGSVSGTGRSSRTETATMGKTVRSRATFRSRRVAPARRSVRLSRPMRRASPPASRTPTVTFSAKALASRLITELPASPVSFRGPRPDITGQCTAAPQAVTPGKSTISAPCPRVRQAIWTDGVGVGSGKEGQQHPGSRRARTAPLLPAGGDDGRPDPGAASSHSPAPRAGWKSSSVTSCPDGTTRKASSHDPHGPSAAVSASSGLMAIVSRVGDPACLPATVPSATQPIECSPTVFPSVSVNRAK